MEGDEAQVRVLQYDERGVGYMLSSVLAGGFWHERRFMLCYSLLCKVLIRDADILI